jgi:hypothetical protein
MIFLEFSSRFSDVLHGTGNNRSMMNGILEKLISFDHFQNCLGMHEKHRITNLI